MFTLPQLFFAFYCAYSGQTVYNDWYITVYNMILTALPLLVKGLFEKDIKIPSRELLLSEDSESLWAIRSKIPSVYVTGRKNLIFTKKAFISWIIFGIFHSAIIFFIPLYASQNGIVSSEGFEMDFACFSITSFSCIMIVVNLKLCLTIRLWNIYHFAAILLLSIFLYLGFILVYDVFGETIFSDSIFVILESYYFYLCIFVCFSWVCVFDGAFFILKRIIKPKNSEVLMFESVKDDFSERNALNQ